MNALNPFPPSLPTIGQDLMARFLSGRPPRTAAAYRDDLRHLSIFLKIDQAAIPATLLGGGHGTANRLVLSWRDDMLSRKLTPSTINRRISAARSFVNFVRELGMIPWSLDVESVKSSPCRDTCGPDIAAMLSIVTAMSQQNDSPRTRRDAALLRLLFDLALRRGEVVALDLADIDLQRGTVFIIGKGQRRAEPFTLSPAATAALKVWIEARSEAPGPLFPSIKKSGAMGERLSGHGLAFIVKGWGKDVGIEIRPHSLRQSGITAAFGTENGNVNQVAKFSRHKDVRTVLIYDDNHSDVAG